MKAILLALSIGLSPLQILADHLRFTLPLLGTEAAPATVHGYLFSEKKETFIVIDRLAPDQKPPLQTLQAAAQAHHCLAASNGGFFHPDNEPLGLMIAGGKVSGRVNTDSSVASGALVIRDGKPRILRARALKALPRPWPRHLLQTGPFLVENRQVIRGLSKRRQARRTFIATDGKGTWLLAVTPPTTLNQLAQALTLKGGKRPFPIQTALNLDGGSSTALWIAPEQSGQTPFYLKEFTRVRNYVGIIPR